MRLLALVALVLLSATGCAGTRAAADDGSTPAPLVRLPGAVVPYSGPVLWEDASIPSRDSRDLTVFAIGSEDAGGSACGPPVLRLSAVETTTQVAVLVSGYQAPPSTVQACPAIGYLASPHLVRLRAPLGDRRLVEASTGKAREAVVGTDYPDITRPPAPFTRAELRRWRDPEQVARTWVATDGRNATTMRLQSEAPAEVRRDAPYGEIVRQVPLAGSTATVYRSDSGADASTDVQWTPNPEQTITLRLSNSEHHRWSVDQAVVIARSVTGYRVEATGALPPPQTPGTAAAVFSSTDGPVVHSEQLFKSSGVYVGVTCEGVGHVDVTLRGTTLRFDCGTEARTAVRESTGTAEATFTIDITATRAVRWAATFARASLDGS